MKKVRLDIYLSRSGLSRSREKAKKEILAGWVKVNSETVRDPAKLVSGDEAISVARPGSEFVSRGGDKLYHALETFQIDVNGLVALDMGASTGGFTHCLLKCGASRVYAVDVGYGQLDYSLRTDSRVQVMEKTNVRHLKREDIKDEIQFITADLSFISIVKVFDTIKDLFSPVEGIILVKPQFEAEPGEHKKGVVKSAVSHKDILERVLKALADKGMNLRGLTFSPLKGPAGNIEFLLYFHAGNDGCGDGAENMQGEIIRVVEEAHRFFEDGSAAGE